ncbi:MAG: hypothetical protein RL173_3362 [Fibrobacterota bacterium]
MKRVTLLVCGAVALMGCGTPERSAGGSSYETENAVAARIVRPDGTPASGTLVRARPLVWIVGDSFDSSLDQRTNSDGRIRMNLPSGGWRLEARQGGVVAVIDIPAQGRIPDLGTVHLASPASVMGRAEPGARIGVGGLQQTAVVDAGGYFHFDSLPAGVHVLRQIGSQARAFVLAQAGQTLDAGILHTDSAGQILLDDFEDGDARSRFGAWTGGGWWWVSGSTGVNLSPDGVDTKPSRAVFADGGGGNVFHVSADFPANADTSARVRCGVDLGPSPVDLSSLASVRFRARGIGIATIHVNNQSAPVSESVQASFALDSAWREVEIPLSRLHQPSWSGTALDSTTRHQHLRRSIGLTWSLSTSGDLWLDDIRLVGPSTTVLWGSSPPP